MSIKPITNCNIISFKAGKTSVFVDFDKTYTPYSHDDMCKNNSINDNFLKRAAFNNYFNGFKNLKEIAKDKFSLTITTGRNVAEYSFVENKLAEQKLDYYSPDTLITCDGGDKYVKINQQWTKDTSKNNEIKLLAKGWNGQEIKKQIKQIFEKNIKQPLIIESPVNSIKWNYPGISVEDELEKTNSENLDKYISFNKNEDNLIEIIFSKKLPVAQLKSLINDYLEKEKIDSELNHYPNANYHYSPQYDKGQVYYEPGNKIVIKPKINNKQLSKVYDVKAAVKNVIINNTNDLIIAAGDEHNDEEMLNLLNYVDILGVNIDKTKSMKETLENPEVLNALKALPLNTIIVGDSPNLEHLREMDRILKQKGINKITCISSPDDPRKGLLNAIKEAMFKYSDENDEYSYYMGMDLFKYLLKTQN